MLRAIAKCWKILTPAEQRQGLILGFFMIFAALLDVMGVGAIGPFLALVVNPDVVETNEHLRRAYEIVGASSRQQFITLIGFLALAALIISSLFRAVVMWGTIRYSSMRRHTLAVRLLRGHLARPYSFFLSRNTTELSKTILSEVEIFVVEVMRPLLQLFSYGVSIIALLILIVAIQPMVALGLMGTVGLAYVAIWMGLRHKLTISGRQRSTANTDRFKTAAEVLGGIKELRITGGERAYLKAFDRSSFSFSRIASNAQLISTLPRYVMQSVAFAAIVLVALWMVNNSSDPQSVVPILGTFAFAGYRMLPALQNVYEAATKLRFGESAADTILKDFAELPSPIKLSEDVPRTLSLEKGMLLRNISFTYDGAPAPAFRCEEVNIPARRTVGIVGPTGAGKSTLVDIILGLLHPQSGELLVDGVTIDPTNAPSWQRSIGYVPQQIFLVDDTVLTNIAFGDETPDRAAVERAARQAQIHDFIVSELPGGYDAVIGERGIRISGGQRQRLGIARALYRQPDMLLLDEATSALDANTELAVMKAIDALAGQRTIIMIAHRTETLRHCDMIIRIEGGKVARVGAPASLL